jgi:hypothetical protein
VAKQTQEIEPQTLELPHDIAERLDKYAAALGTEYLFPVSRQQAFERFARKFLVSVEAVTNGK